MDINAKKEELQAKTAVYKTALQSQVHHLTDDLEETAKKAVFILGAVAAVAVVFRLLSPKKSKKQVVESNTALQAIHTPESPVIGMIKSAIMSFLLNLARERILQFLEELNNRQNGAAIGATNTADNQSA